MPRPFELVSNSKMDDSIIQKYQTDLDLSLWNCSIKLQQNEENDNSIVTKEFILIRSLLKYLQLLCKCPTNSELINQSFFDPNLRKWLLSQCVNEIDNELLIPIDEYWLEIDIYGDWLQKQYNSDYRKSKAINYTSNSNSLISSLNFDFKNVNCLIDPFAGSGRLITSIITNFTVENLSHIQIVDTEPLPLVLACCRIIYVLNKINNKSIKFQAILNDGFSICDTFDLVIMNPPFTRSQLISKETRLNLEKINNMYQKKKSISRIDGHAGLHIWALHHAEMLLNDNGKIISILPASTILSNYSKSVHSMLLSNFNKLRIISNKDNIAFSDGSDLNEIIITAVKSQAHNPVEFFEHNTSKLNPLNKVPINIMIDEWNWSRYFRPEFLIKVCNVLSNTCNLRTATELKLDIIRGVEMYGPDYFFLPNKYWRILNRNLNSTQIQSESIELQITNDVLIPALRKPSNYSSISPIIEDYALVVNQDNEFKILEYQKHHKYTPSVAKKRFGKHWIRHLSDQINSKQPYGHVFIVDKLGIDTAKSMAYYLEQKYLATKNFYLIKTEDKISKLIAAWMNSTWYILLYLLSRREIGGSYGRLQIIDYYKEKLFPQSFFNDDLSIFNSVLDIFDIYRKLELPAIKDQFTLPIKRKLDESFSKVFQIPYDLDQIYEKISNYFCELSKKR
ncbi:MAG: N-6 DNA methylase [Candidatus Heimdallarchaeota archaeon]|nr:N-6 DNA methylase [Candidatus Heimdallarchaeota archaeon]MDH5645842.1 N-6 DNA methylase [Candidatus Heimdallarchaeota archaeon]